jgi:hypothetical protein
LIVLDEPSKGSSSTMRGGHSPTALR